MSSSHNSYFLGSDESTDEDVKEITVPGMISSTSMTPIIYEDFAISEITNNDYEEDYESYEDSEDSVHTVHTESQETITNADRRPNDLLSDYQNYLKKIVLFFNII